MLTRPIMLLVIGICFIPSAIGQTASSTSQPPTRPRVEKASWNQSAQETYGISRDAFLSMGLNQLTKEQYANFLLWTYVRAETARKQGEETGKAEAAQTQPSYSCGPLMTDAAVSKVSVKIEPSEHTSSLILSGLLERLRRIPDVQIVYES